jgi:hypothetical protein
MGVATTTMPLPPSPAGASTEKQLERKLCDEINRKKRHLDISSRKLSQENVDQQFLLGFTNTSFVE